MLNSALAFPAIFLVRNHNARYFAFSPYPQGERIKFHPNCCVEVDSDK
jgi:hypothetical protein